MCKMNTLTKWSQTQIGIMQKVRESERMGTHWWPGENEDASAINALVRRGDIYVDGGGYVTTEQGQAGFPPE